MKVGILLATGFEEGEALFLLDTLRRGNIDAYSISINDDLVVEGSHNIKVFADMLLDEKVNDFDMVILPGGLPGSTNLRDDERVIKLVQDFNEKGKYIGAICAAPIVLAKAGVVSGKNVTSYPAEQFKGVFTDSNYIDDALVVIDGYIITSRGPALTLEFAYQIIDLLGGDSAPLKEGMLYNYLLGKK